MSISLDIDAGIGSCIGATGADDAWGAGNEAAMAAAIEVAIVVVVVFESCGRKKVEDKLDD
jgi:hypothetical protein